MVIERIEQRLTFLNKTKAYFARALGADTPHYNNWRKRGFPSARLVMAAEILDVNLEWLATGAGPMNKQLETLAKKIIYSREKEGFRQEGLADDVNVDIETVQQWEAGSLEPTPGQLDEIAHMLDVPLVWLESPEESFFPIYHHADTHGAAVSMAESMHKNGYSFAMATRDDTNYILIGRGGDDVGPAEKIEVITGNIRLKTIEILISEGMLNSRIPLSLDEAKQLNASKMSIFEIQTILFPRIRIIFHDSPYAQYSKRDLDANVTPVAFKQTKPVPLLSWVQAGNWAEAETMTPADADDWMLCPVKHSDKTFILRVRGASMEPEYRDGDWIFIDPERPAENGAHVIVLMEDDKEATFKKLVTEGNAKYLEALNPEWPDRIIKINGNATILGVVIFSGKPRV